MKLLGKVGIVSLMTGFSRIFGLVREIVMAHFFGTSALQGAFVIAFRIPNLFRRLFGEGALGAAFIPVFAEIEQTQGREAAQCFFARILGLLVCILGLLVGLLFPLISIFVFLRILRQKDKTKAELPLKNE